MSDWGSAKLRALIEIGSAVAVLIGLLFVGVELRQNTDAVEAATFQSLTDASSDWIITIASDPDLLRAWQIGSANPADLDQSDATRYFLITRSFWVRMQNVFSQWRRGTLSDEDWSLYREVLCSRVEGTGPTHGNKITFEQHKTVLSPEFRAYLGSCWNNESAQKTE